ncbi:ABC transporter ATP-binding protein [Aliiglaciecola sp. CAU 1673]|uniref:ABC transporter ATP-binding protein n=1 Tax=Aliiglaciecola sp. CAU 1673 TaxID=3032595 RepID=UPI0023DA7757|nr:ABC transporter ATP-binding protein [Aliiglaciecola sp. CAU 1673]MDF2176921.1 ABC transporter ATP-binding protein [Aliiglaciecola sp. CAU 1673]
MSEYIKVSELTKSFKQLRAVDGISFEVPRGICFGLLGPNGAGKTTTIEMMEGIVTADSGEILYDGEVLKRGMNQRIGIQFQHTALQDHLTGRECIRLFASFYAHALNEQDLIELCHLQDFADQDHRKLSGGQKQRLLLALALVNDPHILFLDEPTTGLDPHARRNFWDLINRIKSLGKTIILTTHYMDEAENLCDDIAIMDRGKIIARGAPKDLLAEHFSGVLIRLHKQSLPDKVMQACRPVQEHGHWFINTDKVEQTLKLLVEEGVNLEGLHVKSANLDDLFLKLTGHGLQDSRQQEAAHV